MSQCQNYFIKYQKDNLITHNILKFGNEKVQKFILKTCNEFYFNYVDFYTLMDDLSYSSYRVYNSYTSSDRSLEALTSSLQMKKHEANIYLSLLFFRPGHELLFKNVFLNSILYRTIPSLIIHSFILLSI
jgi:hypothetical protein